MEKPITMRRVEFQQALAKTINESRLPAFVIADCLALTLAEIQKLSEQQLKVDIEEYQAKLEREENVNE